MLPLLMILAMLAGETPSIVSIAATPRSAGSNGTVEVAIEVVVTDDTDPAPLVRLFRVTANEAIADGDYQLTGTHTVVLAVPENGERIYTLHVEAIDRDGNRGAGTAEIAVRPR